VEIGAEVGSAGCHGVLQHAGRIRELQEVVQQDLQALSGLPPHVIGDGILCIVRLHLRCEVCTVVGKPWLYKQGSSCAV